MKEIKKEVLEGYVVDIICLRKMSPSNYTADAKEHTTACAIMGHCVESGYGLAGEENDLKLLDPKATPLVAELLTKTDQAKGVRLKVERQQKNEEMETVKVSFADK